MISTKTLKGFFSRRLEEARSSGLDKETAYRRGSWNGLKDFYEALGFDCAANGTPIIPRDERGMPYFKSGGRINPEELSLRRLADVIVGHDLVESIYNPNQSESEGFSFHNMYEAALDPTAFIDINTFNLATAGLVNAQLMEKFNQPKFIGRDLVKVQPTKMNGQKLIGVARIGKYSSTVKGRLPGESHASIGFGQTYQTTPETIGQGLKCEVTKEAVFFDLTGDVLEEAGNIGDDLGYGMEKTIADAFIGVSSSYNRNGTALSTYQTASPFINDQVNQFNDFTSVDTSRQLMVQMKDPESGKEIVVDGTDLFFMPGKTVLAQHQMGNPVIIGSSLTGNFPGTYTVGSKPPMQVINNYRINTLSSIWLNRATASDGLNYSATQATGLWFHGDSAKAIRWMENWPMTPWMASADEYTMKDRGIIAVFGAEYRGQVFVNEPRYLIRNRYS